uniref:HMA domain-containing protein n=1 Tax=Oryza nivara TaxID=4536 RepID=A0A0E0IPH1_ORYNI
MASGGVGRASTAHWIGVDKDAYCQRRRGRRRWQHRSQAIVMAKDGRHVEGSPGLPGRHHDYGTVDGVEPQRLPRDGRVTDTRDFRKERWAGCHSTRSARFYPVKKKRSGSGEQHKPASDVAEECQEEDKPAEDNDAAASPDVKPPAATPGTNDKDTSTKADKKDAKEKDKKPSGFPIVMAVLKVDMHCNGSAKRIRSSIRHYHGVEGVTMEVDKSTMTVGQRRRAETT